MDTCPAAGVAISCGAFADRLQVEEAVVGAGFHLDPSAPVVVTDVMVEDERPVARVVLVDSADAAMAAVRSGASAALVWPMEAPRLGRAIEAARHRASDAIERHVFREVFRRNPSWIELTSPDVVLLDVSRGFEEATGYLRQAAVGRTPAELFRGGTHGRAYYDAVQVALRDTGAWHGDMLGRRSDGSLAVVEAHIGSIEVDGRVLAQFATKRQPSNVAPSSLGGWVLEQVSAPWLLVQRRSDAVAEVGPGAAEALGLEREALLARRFSTLEFALELPPPGETRTQDRWLGDRAYELRATGRLVGDAELVLVVFVDVTERLRRAEELNALAHELVMARDQALAADQAKSAFLAGMSHELRTPLTAILGYGEMLADEWDDAQALDDLQRITAAGTHLLGLVDEVLDLARVESGEVRLTSNAFAVRPVLVEVAESVRMRAAEADQQVVVDVPHELQAWGDRQRVLQVVLNLVVNAVKYADPGRIEVGVELLDDRCAIYVQDSGPGLRPDQTSAIFHSFRQFHGTGDGVGLGLAISRRLAEAMGGKLDVVSELGRGSRFRLWLLQPASGAEG